MEEKRKLRNKKRRERYRENGKRKTNIREEPDSDSPVEKSEKTKLKRKGPRKIQITKETNSVIHLQATEPPESIGEEQPNNVAEMVELTNIVGEKHERNVNAVADESPESICEGQPNDGAEIVGTNNTVGGEHERNANPGLILNHQYLYSRPDELMQDFDEMAVFESVMEEHRSEDSRNLSEWKKRKAFHKKKWNENRLLFSQARTSIESPDFKSCGICSKPVHHFVVCCKTCKKELCVSCDKSNHLSQPFHERLFYRTDVFSSQRLLPTNFVDYNSHEVTVQGIPVPCHIPSCCPSCSMLGTLQLTAGSKEKYLITLNGRFDLNDSCVQCTHCNYFKELTEIDYLQSRWWPGAVSGSCYLFCESLLEFWRNLNHQYFGLSTNKFVATLSRMSTAAERNEIIDVTLFEKASREYQAYHHQSEERSQIFI